MKKVNGALSEKKTNKFQQLFSYFHGEVDLERRPVARGELGGAEPPLSSSQPPQISTELIQLRFFPLNRNRTENEFN